MGAFIFTGNSVSLTNALNEYTIMLKKWINPQIVICIHLQISLQIKEKKYEN